MLRKPVSLLFLALFTSASGAAVQLNTVTDTVPRVQAAAGTLSSAPVQFKGFAAKSGDRGFPISLSGDFPLGSGPAARALQKNLVEFIGSGKGTRSHAVNPADPASVFQYQKAVFLDRNPASLLRKKPVEDEPGGYAYEDITLRKDYQDSRVAAWTFVWAGTNYENATSAAYPRSVTVKMSDGKPIGWEAFRSKREVKKLVDSEATRKFGRNAYDSAPFPAAPLFMRDGVKFVYGDYSGFADSHVWEEEKRFPSVVIPWSRIGGLLTPEAAATLGVKATAASSSTAGKKPAAATVNESFFAAFVSRWDQYHEPQSLSFLEGMYANFVDFYGTKEDRSKVMKTEAELLRKMPDFEQVSSNFRVTQLGESLVRVDFEKRVNANGKTTTYPSYLYLMKGEEDWKIVRESDLITDRNIQIRKEKARARRMNQK